ncbi:MAG: immunoglobulin domain-containing protein [Verrucomicrobiales bacterium]|nr:immunoglobulin domain-containing protein [Verrucomicrobiales bacterium]
MIVPGDSAIFTVEAVGTEPLEYQWYRWFEFTGSSPIPGETGPTLTITNALWDLFPTIYFVNVRNSFGAVDSRHVHYTFDPASAPIVVNQPSDIFVRLGSTFQVTIDARGAGPLKYDWWGRNPAVIRPYQFQSSSNPDYTSTASVFTSGTYWVEVFDRVGQVIRTREFEIKVVPAVGPYFLLEPPVFTNAAWGAGTRIRVAAEGADAISYQWYHGTRPVADATGPELYIPRLTSSTAGTYFVRISDPQGHFLDSSKCLVAIRAGLIPEFMVSPSNTVAELGSSVTLTSEAIIAHDSTFSYQWYRNGIAIEGAVHADLTLPSVTPTDLGLYWVTADTGFLQATSAIARLDLPVHLVLPATSRRVSTLAGFPGAGDAIGATNTAAFNRPTRLLSATSGEIFIADTGNHRIKKWLPHGVVQLVAGVGTAGLSDGLADFARFSSPQGLAFDPARTALLVADTDNHLIRRIRSDGSVDQYAGNPSGGYQDGPKDSALFRQPSAMARDPNGNLYILQSGASFLRVITANGQVETYAGSPLEGLIDGPRLQARFSKLAGITADRQGNLYLTEAGGNRIRRISASGEVTTVAGSPDGHQGLIDGHGTNAWFRQPQGIAVDEAGNLFIADTGNHAIRHIAPDRSVTTIGGTGAPGLEDGLTPDTSFNSPTDIAIDSNGNLLVADTGNHRIRMLSAAFHARLNLQRSGSTLRLEWTTGRLQSSLVLGGPWSEVPNATSPFAIPFSDSRKFFRLEWD